MKKYLLPIISLFALTSCGSLSSSESLSSIEKEESSAPKEDSSSSKIEEISSVESQSSSESKAEESSSESKEESSSSEEPITPSDDKEKLPFDLRSDFYEKFPFAKNLDSLPKMPSIHIDNPSGKLDFVTVPDRTNKWDYTDCLISVDDPNGDSYDLTDISGGVKVRGNYTANYDKKPLRIKFDKKQAMLGLNNGVKQKSWVLLADVKDSSMHRNAFTFLLGQMLLKNDGLYCADILPVELYINNQYWGVYLLTEQQQTGSSRVNVFEPEDGYIGSDIGYFFEFDGYYNEEPEPPEGDYTFAIDYEGGGYGQKGYTIKSDIYDPSQVSFLKNYLTQVYKLGKNATKGTYYSFGEDYTYLYKENSTNEKEHLAKFFNLESMVDMYLISEICCDPDIGWSSFYLSADFSETGDKRLRFEAPWDWDSALGNRSGYVEDAKGEYAKGHGNPWLDLFASRPWFMDMVKAKWEKLKEDGSFRYLIDYLFACDREYEENYKANFSRWNHLAGNYQWTAMELRKEVTSCETHHEETIFLADWICDRLTYLDSLYSKGIEIGYREDELVYPWEDKLSFRLEAESGTLSNGGSVRTASTSEASGGSYVSDLGRRKGTTLTFNLNLDNASYGLLSLRLSKLNNRSAISEMYEFYLNNEKLDLPLRVNAQFDKSRASSMDHDWGIVDCMNIDLPKGESKLMIKTRSRAANLDYLEFVSDYVEVN